MSLYGHNEQLYRRVGDRVAPGDVLAAVGDAAGVGKPGLYLEIRKGRRRSIRRLARQTVTLRHARSVQRVCRRL